MSEKIFYALERGGQICLIGKFVGNCDMVILKSRIGTDFRTFDDLMRHEQVAHVCWQEKMRVRSAPFPQLKEIFSPSEHIIFDTLVSQAGKIIPQSVIIKRLQEEGKSEFSLRSLIANIRKKITGYFHLTIKTHYSKGYSLEFSETGFLDPNDPDR